MEGGGSGGGSISGSDLLDKTDWTIMIRVEAARERFGFTLDYILLSLSGSAVVPVPTPLSSNVLADLDLTVLELGGFFRPSGNGVDYLFGMRRIGAETILLVTPGTGPTERFEDDRDLTDIFLGARYLHQVNERWDFSLRGDLSFGDTEETLNLLASIGYRFNELFALQLGYRHTTIEFEDNARGAAESRDIELTGPFLGFVFRFQ